MPKEQERIGPHWLTRAGKKEQTCGWLVLLKSPYLHVGDTMVPQLGGEPLPLPLPEHFRPKTIRWDRSPKVRVEEDMPDPDQEGRAHAG